MTRGDGAAVAVRGRAAKFASVNHPHLPSRFGKRQRGGQTGGTGTNNKYIVFGTVHPVILLPRMPQRRSGGNCKYVNARHSHSTGPYWKRRSHSWLSSTCKANRPTANSS